MLKNFQELLSNAKRRQGTVVGVPVPENLNSILTVINAKKDGLADFILTGNKTLISGLLTDNGGDPSDFEIINCGTPEESAQNIVKLANQNKIDVILKGFLPTATLIKPVLEREGGLRTGNLLSDVLILEDPLNPDNGFVGLTDGGIVILPDLEQKKQLIENSVRVFHRLGYENPNVGIMAAIESVKDSMPATTDAERLTEMNKSGEISGCSVYGPLAFDIAVSPEAAEMKGITGVVPGNVRIMIMPNIEAGNLLGKCFMFYMKKEVAHVVMGAKIPILIPSRNENEIDKVNSIALGVSIA